MDKRTAQVGSSCPVWARGLKLDTDKAWQQFDVVPRVGTWIETYHEKKQERGAKVVPRVGTWIETISIR
ncbi:hypothetical protein ALO_06250 [Acetonema longum DSM 6540]|uniref:Uncharacterized protein n=1 Tax=Acetonema longum DSM 6540 TaxID=1009370 RepID=F7NGR2_9FIRM|nr:hypothetical protein ALO_06250 [Acetonema longum DSM 6540]